MTEKRFTIINREEPRKQSVAEKGIPCSARHCCTRLNRLTEENKQLKKDVEYWKQVANKYNSALNVFYQAYISIYGLTHSEKILLNHFVNELSKKIVLGDDND